MIRLGVLVFMLAALPALRAGAEEAAVQQQGVASYYGDEFKGRKTASGERFRQDKMTAASRELPLGARVKVTNEENGKSVEVKINDRGPYVDGRVVDLTKQAAKRLGITRREGVAPVTVEAKPSRQPSAELKDAVREQAAAAARPQEAAVD